MTTFLLLLVILLAFVLWYALAGRKWLKSKPWTAGFFSFIEPVEIALFKKSETVLVGRLVQLGSLIVAGYDAIAVFASSLDMTPLTTRIFDVLAIPQDMRGLAGASLFLLIGRIMVWLRWRTSKPMETVAIADKDITPAVQEAMDVADIAKDQAVAAVADAKAT